MIVRIIDKETKLYIRDDFKFDPDAEIGIISEPSQGLYRPRWDGSQWIEDMTTAEIEALKAQATPEDPTLEERVTVTENKVVTIEETIDVIFGGV